MFGQNPIRPPEPGDGAVLLLQEIFPTLQGEGPMAGWPAVFVRLGGCNLACSFCDTEFENFQPVALADLLAQVETLARNAAGKRVRDLVVVTGGEPLRQNILPLCAALIDRGFTVQIETNGTLWRDLPPQVQVVCSPKPSRTGPGEMRYGPLRPDMLARALALKFIVAAEHEVYARVPEVGQARHNTPVYVQPMDEQDPVRNARNLAHAAWLAQEHGYRLSLQMHKALDIP